MKKIWDIYKKHEEIVNYLIVGVLTTVVSFFFYYLSTRTFLNPENPVQLQIANLIKWITGVLFAYVTNKIFVFESKNNTKTEILKEIVSFVGFRLFSGVMDIVFMYITVDVFLFNDSLMKITSNVVVVILNYLFSKLFIFKKRKTN